MSRTIIVDDTDANIVYEGTWKSLTSAILATAPEYMNTRHESHAAGSTLSYTFTGTQITVYCSLNTPATYGIPESTYTIDSGAPVKFNVSGEVPNYSTTKSVLSHIPFFKSAQLPEGEHTIKITVTKSNGPLFNFDFFTITTASWENAQNVIVDDRDEDLITYGEHWTNSGGSREYMSSTRVSPGAANTTAVFKFYGTSISTYITLSAMRAYPASPFAAFNLDDRATVYYGAPGAHNTSYHQRVYNVDGLAAGVEHTLTMNAIVIEDHPPWYFDYFVYTPSAQISNDGGSGSLSISGTSSATSSTGSRSATVSRTGSTSTGSNTSGMSTTRAEGQNQAADPTGSVTGNPEAPKTSVPMSAIIGAAAGGVALILFILFIIFWRRRRQRPVPFRRTTNEKDIDNASTASFLPLVNMPSGSSSPSTVGRQTHSFGPVQPQTSAVYQIPVIPPDEHSSPSPSLHSQRLSTTNTGSAVGRSRASDPFTSQSAFSQRTSTDQSPSRRSSARPVSSVAPRWVTNDDRPQSADDRRTRSSRQSLAPPLPTAVVATPNEGSRPLPVEPAPQPERTPRTPRTAPIEEVDAGRVLDIWGDEDEELPDTLPPSYSNLR